MQRLLVVMTVFATAAGCRVSLEDNGPGDDTGPDAGTTVSQTCIDAKSHSDLAWIQDNIFTKSCAFSGCHRGAAASAGSLSLEAGVSHDALVGQSAKTEVGWKRVDAGKASTSYLLVAMGAMQGPVPTGGVMPLGSPALCQDKLDAVQRWVEAGAKP